MATKDTKDVKNIEEDSAAAPATKFFTRAEVAKHKDFKDIWLVIHNNVYDITSFISQVGSVELFLFINKLIKGCYRFNQDLCYFLWKVPLNTIDIESCIFIKFNLMQFILFLLK